MENWKEQATQQAYTENFYTRFSTLGDPSESILSWSPPMAMASSFSE